jgi:UDP-glucose 4-epimerase
MSKCLVTGHRGFIGSHLYEKLLDLGIDVEGVDLKEGKDILDFLPSEDFDFVFHMAALPRVEFSVENPSYTLKHNVLATSKLLEWSKNHGVKRFIFSSSSAIYGNGEGPTSPYGLHKLMCELECKLYSQLYNLDTVCLRYFNAFSADQEFGGAYSTVVCAWMEMIRENKSLRLDGDGEQTRDFVHVEDIVDANIFCMNHQDKFNGEQFEIGTGTSISVNEIKNIVLKYHQVEFKNAPERPGDAKHTLANLEKIKNIGWTPQLNSLEQIEKCFRSIS